MTRLAAFICAMFYGLDSSRRQGPNNDRLRYLPWNSTDCGGWLDYSYKNHNYRIYRTFGKKDKDDTIKLFDLENWEELSDYEQPLGQELFGIDKTAFMNTLYIPQMVLPVSYNASMSTQLIRLTDSIEDAASYDRAIKELDKAQHTYVKTGNRGAIAQAVQKKKQLEKQLYEIKQSVPDYHETCKRKRENEYLLAEEAAELDHLKTTISNVLKKDAALNYKALMESFIRKQDILMREEAFFHDLIPPSEEDIHDSIKNCHVLLEKEQMILHCELTEEQKAKHSFLGLLFARSTPEQTEFSHSQLNLLSNSVYQNEVSLYYNSDLTDDELVDYDIPDDSLLKQAENTCFSWLRHFDALTRTKDDIRTYPEKILEAEDIKYAHEKKLEELDKDLELAVHNLRFFTTTGLVLGIALCLLLFFTKQYIFAGFVLIALPVLYYLYMHSPQLNSILLIQENCARAEKELSEAENNLSNLRNKEFRLKQQLKDLGKRLQLDELELKTLSSFLILPEDLTESVIQDIFSQIATHREAKKQIFKREQRRLLAEHRKALFYQQLQKEFNNFQTMTESKQKLLNQCKQLKTEILLVLSPFYPDAKLLNSRQLESKLHELYDRVRNYLHLNDDVKEAANRQKTYRQSHPVLETAPLDVLLTLSDDEHLEDLQAREKILQRAYTEHLNTAAKLNAKKDILAASMEQYSAIEDDLNEITEQIEEAIIHNDTITRTLFYLKEAKKCFSDRYLRSIENHLKDYAKLLNTSLLTESGVDANFNVHITDQGKSREAFWYSKGTQDLIEFCSRLSIIDDLFPDEEPFLILDDSFINLDDETMVSIRNLIKELSEKKQIIHLTCQKARSLKTIE